jgi:phosphomannomutase
MKNIYLFDVDGTLTEAKQDIDPIFRQQFLKWMGGKDVFIVSGGTFERILGQVGTKILNKTSGIFACMGNAFLQKSDLAENPSLSWFCINDESGFNEWQLIYENNFIAPEELSEQLDRIVSESEFPIKTGRHHEVRTGMVNFSIVGRNANREQRKQYELWDAEKEERKEIISKLKEKYKSLDFVIGGAVSVDIFNKGNDKSQIIKRYFGDALEHNKIHFVGDRIAFPGNDHTLAEKLRAHPNGAVYEVEMWEDTAKLLKSPPFM